MNQPSHLTFACSGLCDGSATMEAESMAPTPRPVDDTSVVVMVVFLVA